MLINWYMKAGHVKTNIIIHQTLKQREGEGHRQRKEKVNRETVHSIHSVLCGWKNKWKSEQGEEGEKTHQCANGKKEMNENDSIFLKQKTCESKRKHLWVFALQQRWHREGKDASGNIWFQVSFQNVIYFVHISRKQQALKKERLRLCHFSTHWLTIDWSLVLLLRRLLEHIMKKITFSEHILSVINATVLIFPCCHQIFPALCLTLSQVHWFLLKT